MPMVPFYKVSPSGNMTILLEETPYTQKASHGISGEIISSQHLGGEQVAFIELKKGILRMAGGEFCANATRALGLVMAMQECALQPGCQWHGSIQTSGFKEPLAVTVKMPEIDKIGHGHDVSLRIPILKAPAIQELAKGVVLVTLPGISHLLIDAELYPFSPQHWQESAQTFRQKFDLEQIPAVGCLWWRAIKGTQSQNLLCALHMHPVVLVKNPYSLYYENACGSGTLALGLWLQQQSGKEQFYVRQPGGYLTLSFHVQQGVLMADLGGPVHLVAQGEAYLTAK